MRVLADLCTTCLFHPGNRAGLHSRRLTQLIRDALTAGGQIPCHSTLPPKAPPGTKAAICRGFANAYWHDILALRLAAVLGHVVEVQPPGPQGEQP